MTPPLFELRQASVSSPLGHVLQGLDWTVRPSQVTALLGPAGSGKSAVLRGLAGRSPALGWRYEGRWLFEGRDLRHLAPPNEIRLVPQLPQGRAGATGVESRSDWAGLLQPGLTVLLDEPTRRCADGEVGQLVERLRAHKAHGSALVITHDLGFARAVADDVCLLCAGRVVFQGSAEAFFESPPDDLSARFLRQGNCWPSGPLPPPLPSHFHWVLPARLAGMGRPGLLGDADQDLEAVAAAGVTLLVTLTERSLPAPPLASLGLRARHFSIVDMGIPALGPTANLCREIEREMAGGGAVAVHCHAGQGRTGTILAALLVWLGRSADEAVAEVRAVARGYIQNAAQQQFVSSFAQALRPSKQEGGQA